MAIKIESRSRSFKLSLCSKPKPTSTNWKDINLQDMESKIEPIPQPSKAPIVGNLGDIDVNFPLDSMVKLANKYGPIFKLNLPGLELVVLSDWDLVHEVCDDSRFRKSIKGDLEVTSLSRLSQILSFGFWLLT